MSTDNVTPADTVWCGSCNRDLQPTYTGCNTCIRNRLKHTPWASGNERIDAFIRKAQQEETSNFPSKFLEWIPNEELADIKFLARGGFGTVYKALWKKGSMYYWDAAKCDFGRRSVSEVLPGLEIALKSLDDAGKVEDF